MQFTKLPRREFLLPSQPLSSYAHAPFSEMDSELRDKKSKLDCSDTRRATVVSSVSEPYKSLRRHIEIVYDGQLVTTTWLKYYEIVSKFEVVHAGMKNLFFNSCLPGGAFFAVNHYMANLGNGNRDGWLASFDCKDRKFYDIYGLVATNKHIWVNGDGCDGDCSVTNTVAKMVHRIKKRVGELDFYSHDAGIDATSDYNNQEKLNMETSLGCMLVGLLCLKEGGNLVGKHYTYFHTLSWNLICLYSCLFDEFYLCKPLSSKKRNSEIYLVGKGYRKNQSVLNALIDRKINFSNCPMLQEGSVDESVLRSLTDFARERCRQQMEGIDEFVADYGLSIHEVKQKYNQLSGSFLREWLQLYPISRISKRMYIPTKANKAIAHERK